MGSSAKRMYDRWRRSRVKQYHKLYKPLDGADPAICYYCGEKPANTLDHCPALLQVSLLGVTWFEAQGIPFLLIPACMECNNGVGTGHAFIDGDVVQFDFRKVRREIRAKELASRSKRGKA